MAKLYFYYSAMNAGKSTMLLQASYNYKERGLSSLLFAPEIDTRFGAPTVYSRIGLEEEAIGFNATTNLFDIVADQKHTLNNLSCILIDEVHFLKKTQIAQLTRMTTELNIAVLCYGLRSDFLGEPFEGSTYLLAWADEICEIKTICHCGKKATMNLRIDSQGLPVQKGDQIQIGGNESYTSVCLQHFMGSVPIFKGYSYDKQLECAGV